MDMPVHAADHDSLHIGNAPPPQMVASGMVDMESL